MLFLKFFMMATACAMFVVAAVMVGLDFYRTEQYNRLLARGGM